MSQKSIRPGRKAKLLLAASLLAVFVGGSLFYVGAYRRSEVATPLAVVPIAGQSSLNAMAEPAALIPASTEPFQEIYCASDNGRRNWCTADTQGGVRLVRQRSGSNCVQGRTWGFDRRGIWVDRGCRADFAINDRNSGRDRDRGRDRDYDRNRGNNVQTFYCESGDMKRHWCSEGIGGTVRLVNQKSDAACIKGRTWGQDRQGVWVDRGCRADFEVVRR
jgi:hypothetical protein